MVARRFLPSPQPSSWNGEGEPHPDPLHSMEREEYKNPKEKKLLIALKIYCGESLPLRYAERVGVR